ncbi:MAG: MFS transporter [Firmicutes bacterium]|nr:MFS transporter [Bacillota bacterium]
MGRFKDLTLVLMITFLYHTMNQMFVPTLPLYITGLGGSEVVVGVIVGLLSLGSIGFKVFFGKLATRRSNVLVLRIGLVVATCVMLLYQPFLGFAFLGVTRLLQSLGLAGYVAGAQGLLSENTRADNRGLFFGVFAAMIGLGMVVGPLLGSFIADHAGYSALFWGGMMVVAVAMVLSFLIDGKSGHTGPSMGRKYQPHSPWKNRDLLVISGTMFLSASIMGATSSIFTLHAGAVGIANASLFFSLFALTYTLSGALSGYLSDRFGRTAMIVPGFCLLIIGLLFLTMLNGNTIMVLAAVCIGIGFGFVNTVLMAMVPGVSVNAIDASNDLAFFSNAFDLGIVLGSIGLSWLATYSYGLLWLAVALTNVFGLLLYLRFNPEKRRTLKAQV